METLAVRPQSLIAAWHETILRLEAEVAFWCKGQHWSVSTTTTHVMDMRPQYGFYDIPSLSVETPSGRLIVEPMAHSLDGTGLVRLYAWPTLYRVRLLHRGGNIQWEILTDSGIPIHEDWNERTFLTLATDLLGADY